MQRHHFSISRRVLLWKEGAEVSKGTTCKAVVVAWNEQPGELSQEQAEFEPVNA